MSYLDHVRACNRCDISGFLGFWVGGERVGWVRRALAERLAAFPDIVTVTEGQLALLPRFDSFESRSKAMALLIGHLVRAGLVPELRGELYGVYPSWGAPPLLALDRAAAAYFGVISYGVHVNGFVRGDDGEIALWIATRARDRSVAPGKLDNMIAGGQPYGLSLRDNLAKEAAEEAAIGPELIAAAVPTGIVTYRVETPPGVKVDCLFIYDLEVPAAVVPRNTDGEVESFALLPWQRVAELVRDTEDFKFNCNLVIIDFLIRHGKIMPDHPDYIALAAGVRSWG